MRLRQLSSAGVDPQQLKLTLELLGLTREDLEELEE
jgi:hypothetical protein